jgi:hypothetical protein
VAHQVKRCPLDRSTRLLKRCLVPRIDAKNHLQRCAIPKGRLSVDRLTEAPRRGTHSGRARRPMRRARWRSESPPTVFDWLTRAVLKRRAAFTGPIFGTATSRSSTGAVDTCSAAAGTPSRRYEAREYAVTEQLSTSGDKSQMPLLLDRAWACLVGFGAGCEIGQVSA